MITEINQSKVLTRHISCESKPRFDERNCNSDQWWNTDLCWCECKKSHVYNKDYVWNLATCNYENGKYLVSFMDALATICEEIIDEDDKTKSIPKNFNEKEATCEAQSFYFLLVFLLITIALFIAVTIYCYLIIYRAKLLLPFHCTENELI